MSYLYKISQHGAIPNGQCVDVIDSDKLNIIAFSTQLNTDSEITINLDTQNEIEELNEADNNASGSVNSGDDYYYAPGINCEGNTCFDSDGGKISKTAGQITFVHNNASGKHKDTCFGSWGTQLKEYFCQDIQLLSSLLLKSHNIL